MREMLNFSAAAFATCLFVLPAMAAAPDAIDPGPPAAKVGLAAISSADPYRLDTEMVVHNWVLCISADRAESLARARGESAARGKAVYDDLAAAKTCGRFPEMQVILQQPVYEPAMASASDGHAFGALVRLSGQWAKAFVVSSDE